MNKQIKSLISKYAHKQGGIYALNLRAELLARAAPLARSGMSLQAIILELAYRLLNRLKKASQRTQYDVFRLQMFIAAHGASGQYASFLPNDRLHKIQDTLCPFYDLPPLRRRFFCRIMRKVTFRILTMKNASTLCIGLLALSLIGCATPKQAPVFKQPLFATLDVAIGEMYGNQLVKIGSRGFRLKIDGVEVKPQPEWYAPCVAQFGKMMVCDHGDKYIYGTAVTKFNIKPGHHTVELCQLGDCASQEVDFIDEYHTQTIGFVYHFKEYEYRKVAQYQGITWEARFEKNRYDAYIESVTSERGMKKLLDAIVELKKAPVQKQPKIRRGSGFDK